MPSKSYFLLNALLDWFCPPRCPICDGALSFPSDHMPHVACLDKVHFIRGPTCMKCGKPIDNSRYEYCYDCNRHKHHFEQGKALFLYHGPMKLAMYRFKYSNRREYASYFAYVAREMYGTWMDLIKPDLILPVPMYAFKERQRGYNQAAVFAQALSEEFHIPCIPELASRTRNTKPQKQLNEIQRKNNLKKAFHVDESVVKYRRILLVDDIYTTGSTIDAVARELEKVGISNIFFLCICIGRID